MAQQDGGGRRFGSTFVGIAAIIVMVAGCANGPGLPPPAAEGTSSRSASSSLLASSATSATPSLPVDFAAAFQTFAETVPGEVGVALAAVGDQTAAEQFGEWNTGPAWSTIKVPLSIAAIRESDSPDITDAVDAAITRSDNAAAETLWQSLGTPDVAAQKVEAVLGEAGAPTTVESNRIRSEYSAFGQTVWSLTDQVRFLSSAACNAGDAAVLDLMGQVETDQRWGLGGVDGAVIKGGWGPELDGGYLIRQIAIVPTPEGRTAVAMAAKPTSGSFDDGTAILTALGTWLADYFTELPAGQCKS